MPTTKKDVLILFGGESAEHEVSIITGLQVVENIDRDKFTPHIIYIHKDGRIDYKGTISGRKQFKTTFSSKVDFGLGENGGYISVQKGLSKKAIFPVSAYMAFHGGTGESGVVQGFLETLHIPYTSPSYESSVITMNKHFTKLVLEDAHLPTLTYKTVTSDDLPDIQRKVQEIESALHFPVIVKPAHLGSSIGIHLAKTPIELEKALRTSLFMDAIILVEPFIESFTEYNISVRSEGDQIATSPIEKPLAEDEILSFADKYEKGGKKSGKGGMAALDRQIPAKISDDLKTKIEDFATKAYRACYCTGLVRIDFMIDDKDPENPVITEINPIPGSVSFYIWEAAGYDFQSQITHALEDAITQFKKRNGKDLDYTSDIAEKFINQSTTPH